ncbi:ArsR family transcriptional regulator [Haloplanus rallus]|jgi:DNA-binding transcriptional ArsR family regulator|uniref:ArsR family transcriptional regulator n=1 Tax=Haloplanus rallus TaxID=1816183 RepID=A0A6B9F7G6_9EURY|nr:MULTISPECIES: winged helix-turn-helix domain-containing protein [Haloplanus]QGX94314.1 ArsR family transcriptional regulator [Haloplanus rallus]
MTSYTPPPTPDEQQDTDRTDEVLALLEDDYSRAILEALHADPRPARGLVEACDASRATIYRRLDRLEDAGLVDSWLSYDADGHHRTVFEATLDAVTVGLDGDGIGVTVTTDDAAADGSVAGD